MKYRSHTFTFLKEDYSDYQNFVSAIIKASTKEINKKHKDVQSSTHKSTHNDVHSSAHKPTHNDVHNPAHNSTHKSAQASKRAGFQEPQAKERKKKRVHLLMYESLIDRMDAYALRKGVKRVNVFEAGQ